MPSRTKDSAINASCKCIGGRYTPNWNKGCKKQGTKNSDSNTYTDAQTDPKSKPPYEASQQPTPERVESVDDAQMWPFSISR